MASITGGVMKKKQRNYVFTFLVLVALGAVSGVTYLGLAKFENANKKTIVDQSSDNNTKQNGQDKQAQTDTKINLSYPTQGASLIGSNRRIEGQSVNTGGTIFYSVFSNQDGLVASGKIETSDSNETKNFSYVFSYDKKPATGDTGYLRLYILDGSTQKEITSSEVVF